MINKFRDPSIFTNLLVHALVKEHMHV